MLYGTLLFRYDTLFGIVVYLFITRILMYNDPLLRVMKLPSLSGPEIIKKEFMLISAEHDFSFS